MLRDSLAGGLLVLLSVVAGRCPAVEQDIRKSLALADDPDPKRRPDPDDATLRRLLGEAAGEVAAAQGEQLDSRRSWTFLVLAEAQESVGDTEGARLSRKQAVRAKVSNEKNRPLWRRWRGSPMNAGGRTTFPESSSNSSRPAMPGGPSDVHSSSRLLPDISQPSLLSEEVQRLQATPAPRSDGD